MSTHNVQVRAQCPQCETITTFAADDLLLRIGNYSSGYRFACPSCASRIERPANPYIIEALLDGGVAVLYSDLERGTFTPDNPLTMDEVLDFAFELATTDTPQTELTK